MYTCDTTTTINPCKRMSLRDFELAGTKISHLGTEKTHHIRINANGAGLNSV